MFTSTKIRAFTLLEMVAVLVLILVLAGIAVPTYQAVVGETRENAAVLSAQAYRNAIDAYASSQNIPPDQLSSALLDSDSDDDGVHDDRGLLAAELPENATTSVDAGVVILCLDNGSDDRCAEIVLATSVGGQSQVSAYTAPVAPSTYTFTHTGNTRTVTITGNIGTVTFSTGTSFYLDGLTQISETEGAPFPAGVKTVFVGLSQDGTESYAGSDQGVFLRAKLPDGSVVGGGTCDPAAGGSACGAVVLFSTGTTVTGYRVFTDLGTPGVSGALEAAAGRFNGSAWVPTSDYVVVGTWSFS